jgi:hypothetical protein
VCVLLRRVGDHNGLSHHAADSIENDLNHGATAKFQEGFVSSHAAASPTGQHYTTNLWDHHFAQPLCMSIPK